MSTYQLPKRNGYKNTFKQGITPAENYGTNPLHNTGVPQTGHKGELKEGQGIKMGVPMPGSGNVGSRVKPKPACSATTKKGSACKAAPIRGTDKCVGHTDADGS